ALTTLSAGDLRSIPDSRLANQRLATDILTACGDTPDSDLNDVLLAAACIENWNVNCHMLEAANFLSIFSLARLNHERCPDFGPQEPVTAPKSMSLDLDFHMLRFTRASGRPNEPMLELCILLPGLLAALTLILAPGLIPFLLHRRFTRRRATKRERKNLCPECAYPLPFSASA
ncbi:MAG: hypothetical protein KF705_02390, partial [Phycisphaeraceae bacterium]|nr:hypothetical protein [Phycisphaeraceae bacterium]